MNQKPNPPTPSLQKEGRGGGGEALGRVSFMHNGCEKRP